VSKIVRLFPNYTFLILPEMTGHCWRISWGRADLKKTEDPQSIESSRNSLS